MQENVGRKYVNKMCNAIAEFYLGVKLDDREVEFWVRVKL